MLGKLNSFGCEKSMVPLGIVAVECCYGQSIHVLCDLLEQVLSWNFSLGSSARTMAESFVGIKLFHPTWRIIPGLVSG